MKEEVTRLLQALIRIDSQNPPGRETAIIEFIRTYLSRCGIDSKIYEFKSGRPNLVCTMPSLHSKRSILFTPHVDTVPATGRWRFGPLSGTRLGNRIYGRGATDCKANVAVSLTLARLLKEKNIRLHNLDLVFAFSADEETGSYWGAIPLARKLRGIDYGVVLDADDFNIIVAQKGLLHVRVELFGKEAHGAYPERGINAVEKGIGILTEILDKKFVYRKHALLKKPTINVGRFVGGDKVNIVAGYCFFELDIRYLPLMTQSSITRRIEQAIRKHRIRYRIKVLAHQGPIEIDTAIPPIVILQDVLRRHRIPSKLSPSFGATVINFLQAQGIESFAFGFGSKGNAHTKNESVKASNLYKGVEVLLDYVQRLDASLAGQ